MVPNTLFVDKTLYSLLQYTRSSQKINPLLSSGVKIVCDPNLEQGQIYSTDPLICKVLEKIGKEMEGNL